ncbi:hypothetical protein [Sedimentimonas flavescens]|uniref:hypothetical protein n=1 Tax=Sedimentimonas flavescens TaxID=2851012 RepID=UPI001C49E88A|nr:hypothetical protein [Sedimentimonas flavescens]MBW0159487.1 hypothetical protein [Sedimentimonas flavescens]
MKRWMFRILLLGVLGIASLWVYDFYRAGILSLPDIPDGAYTLSYKNGFRAIVLDADVSDPIGRDGPKYFRSLGVANRDRKYLGVPFDVQPWFKEAWSWCKSPTEQEKAELERMPDDFRRKVANARFEAVCRIDVDGTDVVRGLIFSVPRL